MAPPLTTDSSVSSMSDRDLMTLLAKVDESLASPNPTASNPPRLSSLATPARNANATSSAKSTSKGKELQALEDLEKELGLDGMNLFGHTPSAGRIPKESSVTSQQLSAAKHLNLNTFTNFFDRRVILATPAGRQP